jgi:phage portal protein BeeE
LLVGYLCLRGNAYCFIERNDVEVTALWPLHPDKVTVEISGRELVYKHNPDGTEKTCPIAEILHIRGCLRMGLSCFLR